MIWRYVQSINTGLSHQVSKLPCQDAAICRTVSQEIFLGVVSDGAGSACRGQVGSQLLTELILKNLEEHFSYGKEIADISKNSIEEWVQQALREIDTLAIEEGLSRRDYACTLLGAAVTPRGGLFFQIGDGAIVISSNKSYSYIFWPMQGEYANSTYFVTDLNYLEQLEFEIRNETIEDLALFTDGLQRLVLNFQERKVHEPFFAPMFLRLSQEPNHGLSEILSQSLARFLDSEDVCKRTEDDKTLILATCRTTSSKVIDSEEETTSDATQG